MRVRSMYKGYLGVLFSMGDDERCLGGGRWIRRHGNRERERERERQVPLGDKIVRVVKDIYN